MSSQNQCKDYVVRVPRSKRKRYHMMRFNSEHGADFFKNWSQCQIEREALRDSKLDEEMPKFGAGSEFGREQREEARRKRYGINIRKEKAENQPWHLTVGGKGGKKFRGVREGGVAENAAWFVFMQGKDGAFEAYPIEEWYNFHPQVKYKSLSAEEAEKEFERRDKIMNYFQVMYEKKLKKDNADPDEDEQPKKGSKKKKDLLLSEMEEWGSEDEGGEDEDEAGSDEDRGPRKKKGNKGKRKEQGGKRTKKDDGDSDNSCIEESDEFDDGAEHDYISGDSSDSDHMNEEVVGKELAGVEEDEAVKNLLESEESSEGEKEEEEENEEEDKDEEEGKSKEKKKKKKKKKDRKREREGEKEETPPSSGDEAKRNRESEEKESDSKKAVNDLKKKVKADPLDMAPNAKRQKLNSMEVPSRLGMGSSTSVSADSGVTEDSIRRYLMRKPMTTTELLQKFKSKKTGLSSEQLVQCIALILKKVNPVKQMVQGKMYLSVKPIK